MVIIIIYKIEENVSPLQKTLAIVQGNLKSHNHALPHHHVQCGPNGRLILNVQQRAVQVEHKRELGNVPV